MSSLAPFSRNSHLMSSRHPSAALPQKDRELIRWLFLEDRPKDDVCRELNIDRDYLRVLFHRAKKRFRERFAAVETQS